MTVKMMLICMHVSLFVVLGLCLVAILKKYKFPKLKHNILYGSFLGVVAVFSFLLGGIGNIIAPAIILSGYLGDWMSVLLAGIIAVGGLIIANAQLSWIIVVGIMTVLTSFLSIIVKKRSVLFLDTGIMAIVSWSVVVTLVYVLPIGDNIPNRPNVGEYIFPLLIGYFAFIALLAWIVEREWKMVALLNQMSHAKEMSDFIAYRDRLTGLPNRNSILDHLNALTSDHATFFISFIDVDKFKSINDTYGHGIGDEVLIEVARRLEKHFNERGEMVGRLGGDEFLLIKKCSDREQLNKKMVAFLKDAEEPIKIGNFVTNVSLSCGVAEFPQHANTAKSILKISDVVMYHAKSYEGNMYIHYEPWMLTEYEKTTKHEVLMNAEITKNDYDIELIPQTMISSKDIIGYTAKIRWQTKEIQLIKQAQIWQFIQTRGYSKKVMRRTTNLVINEIKQNQEYQSRQIEFIIPFELLQNRIYMQELINKFESNEIEAKNITFAILQSSVNQISNTTMSIIQSLKLKGIKFTLDAMDEKNQPYTYILKNIFDNVKIKYKFIETFEQRYGKTSAFENIVKLISPCVDAIVVKDVKDANSLIYLQSCGIDVIEGDFKIKEQIS